MVSVVKVRGYPLSNNTTVIARQLDLTSASGGDGSEVTFQGPVTDIVMSSSVDVLGINISTIGISEDKFKHDDVVIGSASFYSTISVGSIVKLTGQLNLGVVTWQEVEIED